MKTKHITLRENTALIELSNYAGKKMDDLTYQILNCLISQGFLYDCPEECSETLEDVLKANDHTLQDFAVYCFKVCTPRILTILKGVQIWGKEYDCESCGCEMRYDDISEHNECTNETCGCSININNSPDPDQNRDDCQMNNPIEINELNMYDLN